MHRLHVAKLFIANLLAAQYKVNNFTVIATYCICSWVPYNGSNLITEWKIENDTSVVLTTWRGIGYSGGNRTRIDNLPPLNAMPVEGFKVSKLVIVSAKNFLKSVTHGKPFIGIQMRSEHFWFIFRDKIKTKLMWKCFSKISEIRESLLKKDPDLTSLHFLDLGQWGSAFDSIEIDRKPSQHLIEETVFNKGKYKVNEYTLQYVVVVMMLVSYLMLKWKLYRKLNILLLLEMAPIKIELLKDLFIRTPVPQISTI